MNLLKGHQASAEDTGEALILGPNQRQMTLALVRLASMCRLLE